MIRMLKDADGRVWVGEQTRSSREFGYDPVTTILTFGLFDAAEQGAPETGSVLVNGKEHSGRFIDDKSAPRLRGQSRKSA